MRWLEVAVLGLLASGQLFGVAYGAATKLSAERKAEAAADAAVQAARRATQEALRAADWAAIQLGGRAAQLLIQASEEAKRNERIALHRAATVSATARMRVEEELRSQPKLIQQAVGQQRRVALVIGNELYQHLPKLKKSVGDATSVAQALTDLGFDVTHKSEVDVIDFDGELNRFYERIAPGDTAFFFFAGHGVSKDGRNFLLPVEMPELGSGDSYLLDRYAVDAGRVMEQVEKRGAKVAFIVLDACRNDPFARSSTRGAVALGGLTEMPPRPGTFVIYSAGIGQTALDRLSDDDQDPNSVFTRKFWPILKTPGLPVVEIAKRTQVEVSALAAKVRHTQAPAYYDQVIGQFYFQPPQPSLYGLVVSVDQYGDKRLRGPKNDAIRIKEALTRIGAKNVDHISDDDARLKFLEYAWSANLDRAQPGDTIVLTFSGLGTRLPALGKGEEPDQVDEALLLAGADAASPPEKETTAEPGQMLTDDILTEWMERAAAKNVNVVLMIDAAFGSGLLDREFANVSFIGASSESETAVERVLEGRTYGVASYAFAKALEGGADYNQDTLITQLELFTYVKHQVLTEGKNQQVPGFAPELPDAAPALALAKLPSQEP
jgi:uncharacterized caspase-like protein